jgi:hypothetical protein
LDGFTRRCRIILLSGCRILHGMAKTVRSDLNTARLVGLKVLKRSIFHDGVQVTRW